ncbi:hypothetical protein [Scytonema sp. NUACC26]|uniref:hypothetical protein n=1 Tax=Scytonema sp. NUACC26 TaxID=3140176 RepID=UPI0034DC34D3
MSKKFLPVFSVDWSGLVKRLKNLEGNYGILAPISCYKKLLMSIRDTGKPFFIDSGVFENRGSPWYSQIHCEFQNDRWVRQLYLASEQQLRQKIKEYIKRCDEFSPDYVFAPDIFGEPLLSLYLARLAWEEYWTRQRTYTLIGVVQVGSVIYNWSQKLVPQPDSFPPHYESPKSFLASLISAYRGIGYEYLALGGLLKADNTMPTGLKFGMSSKELDELLAWSRPEFVLGGLALTRLEVLKKHNVWADSTNWLWWTERYDYQRFSNRDVFQEVLS